MATTSTKIIAVADLTEGQLYDEVNPLLLAQHRGYRISGQQQARLIALEAEFSARHAKALTAS